MNTLCLLHRVRTNIKTLNQDRSKIKLRRRYNTKQQKAQCLHIGAKFGSNESSNKCLRMREIISNGANTTRKSALRKRLIYIDGDRLFRLVNFQ
ncbi:hypothetical protein Y027_4693 [Burkholderia pseudomallei TSV5]|nr:hypothetical protein Y027_4693 [Burkholderia pseudomallei TSV5]